MFMYPNLLSPNVNLENFWKMIVERLTIGDAPFLTRMSGSFFLIGREKINLEAARAPEIVAACSREWNISAAYMDLAWKDIRKQTVKNILLYNYVCSLTEDHRRRDSLLLLIHNQLNNKIIKNDNIHMDSNCFKIDFIDGIDEL